MQPGTCTALTAALCATTMLLAGPPTLAAQRADPAAAGIPRATADAAQPENDRALVSQAAYANRQERMTLIRGCLKPAGAWQRLYHVDWGRGIDGSLDPELALRGTWVAWTDTAGTGCPLMRHDLATGETAPVEPSAEPYGGPCVTAFDLAPTGAIAWTENAPDRSERLAAQRPDGTVVTLDSAPAPGPIDTPATLTEPRIGDDGRTVTWLSAGQPRSAAL